MKDAAIEILTTAMEVHTKHFDAKETIEVLNAVIEHAIFMINLIDDE